MYLIQYLLSHFFAPSGQYPASGMFSFGHFILLAITLVSLFFACRNIPKIPHEKIRKTIRNIIGLLWLLEISKITLQFHNGNGHNLNTWVPLYFCSIALFAGLLSGFSNGIAQHIGDVFLVTGGLVGGTLFLLYPSSSLLLYPAYHFLSIHSFLYHGCMVYISILLSQTKNVSLNIHDIKYYAIYVGFFCILAWVLNINTDSNLMFISKPFEGTFLVPTYHLLGIFYTPLLVIVQMFLPFYGIYFLQKYATKVNPFSNNE